MGINFRMNVKINTMKVLIFLFMMQQIHLFIIIQEILRKKHQILNYNKIQKLRI